MKEMMLTNRHVLRVRDLDKDWSKKAFESCERFLQASSMLAEKEYLGFAILPREGGNFQANVFTSTGAKVADEDFRWMFETSALMEKAGWDQPEVGPGSCHHYVLQREKEKVSGNSDKEFARHFKDYYQAVRTLSARVCLLAGPEREGGRGLLLLGLTGEMTLRMRTILLLLFPGTVVREIREPEELERLQKLPAGYLMDGMMGIMAILHEQYEAEKEARADHPDGCTEENPWISVDDEEFDLADDDFEPALLGTEEMLSQDLPDDASIEELELSVRAFNCLMRAGIRTMGELRAMSVEDLLKVRNLGRKSAREILEKLGREGEVPEEGTDTEKAEGKPRGKEASEAKKMEQDPFETLQNLVGLANVKEQVGKIAAFGRMRRDLEEKRQACEKLVLNMEFVGNPGTAKTTVARILAKIFYKIGLLESSEILEVGRPDLVAGYVGQTAERVKEVFGKARGRLLFIDEAYSMVDECKNNFTDEAISTMVQEMENHREETIVIFAGYPEKMDAFFETNPGLRSRVPFRVCFEDYSAEEMVRITVTEAKRRGFEVSKAGAEKIEALCMEVADQADAGNGRFCRNLAENAILNYAARVYGKEGTGQGDFVLTEKDFSVLEKTSETREVHAIGFLSDLDL